MLQRIGEVLADYCADCLDIGSYRLGSHATLAMLRRSDNARVVYTCFEAGKL